MLVVRAGDWKRNVRTLDGSPWAYLCFHGPSMVGYSPLYIVSYSLPFCIPALDYDCRLTVESRTHVRVLNQVGTASVPDTKTAAHECAGSFPLMSIAMPESAAH
ncbi:hypothetical protein GOBAR_AA37135 [Gossypium barbadense]|uniref:Uncharacterized protein n=1 Tax=Gossypium barbadense TaxID=3634 RepID=A0A2P5VXP1_GOSBA|nr:hypothetical protein GOBAR_AA37135 [Gossypium barbadense]